MCAYTPEGDALSPINIRAAVANADGRLYLLRGLRAEQAVAWADKFLSVQGHGKAIVFGGRTIGNDARCLGKKDGLDDAAGIEWFMEEQLRISVTQNVNCVEHLLLRGDRGATVVCVPGRLAEVLAVVRMIARVKGMRTAPFRLFFLVDARFSGELNGIVEAIQAYSGESMVPSVMQRALYLDTGPDGCGAHSRPHSFLKPSSVMRGKQIDAHLIPSWSKMRIEDASPVWSLMSDSLFSRHPNREAYAGWCEEDFISSLETWAHRMESTEEFVEASFSERQEKADLLRISFQQYQMRQAVELVDEVVALFAAGADVVSLNAPAGAGKSLLAAAIVKRLIAVEREGQEGGRLTRGEADRPVASLTKSIQVVPSASNAAALTRFTTSMVQPPDSTVCGATHSLCTVGGALDAEMEGVEHLIVPYSAAEKLLELGTFKMVILDEAHCGDSQISTCLLKALRNATGAPLSDGNPLAGDSQRVDKVLVMYGVVDVEFEDQLRRMVEAASLEGCRQLSYEHIQVPADAHMWKKHRFPVVEHIAHSPWTKGTKISEELARRLGGIEERFLKEDREVCSPRAIMHGLTKVPTWLVARCATATRVLMAKFRDEANAHMEWVNAKRNEVKAGRLIEARFMEMETRYKFPSILVCVPSTGVARDVVKLLRFNNDDNLLRPFPGSRGAVQPYRIDISCARDHDEEEVLTRALNEFPEWYVRGDEEFCKYIVKGRVIIAVNGTETGLTIPDVGGIVEMGMEWMRDGYSRCGLNSSRFFLTDRELAQQRLGRGGRTRPTDHIMCLGPEARGVMCKQEAAVLCKLRASSMNQVDFVRQACEPALRNQPSLRSCNWTECAVEGRVNGTVMEDCGVGEGEELARPVYAPGIEIELRNFPTLDPILAQLLRAFVSNGLALHGVIRVALLATGSTALMKPSSGNMDSVLGPCPLLNSLDIFCKGIVSYAHGGCALQDYEGDSLPLVEMHAQLIKAARWNLTDEVPDRLALMAAANNSGKVRAMRDNFWIGNWLPCGRVKFHEALSKRMDVSKSCERANASFTYGRLVCDEERRKLWSVIRMLVFDLRLAGFVVRPEDVGEEELNVHVRTVYTDPLLKLKGRALFALINTAFSTRYASVEPECRSVRMKATGTCKVYNRVMRDDGSDGVCTVEGKRVRAESIWNIRKEHKWLRFDPSCTTRASRAGDWHITTADPVTDEQCAIFANIVGRWRAGEDWKPSGGGETGFVEVEMNACPALFGTRLEVSTREHVKAVADLRSWVRSFIGFYPNRCDPRGDYARGVDCAVKLWKMTSSAASQSRAPAFPCKHFDD